MKIDKILEQASGTEKKILEDPENFEFRASDPEFVELSPDHNWMDEAFVDIINDNVEIRFATQSPRERYVAVCMTDEYTVVESQGTTTVDGELSKTQLYYLASDTDTYMFDRDWSQYFNERPLEVADQAPKLYRKALNEGGDELDWGDETDHVPPPEEGF